MSRSALIVGAGIGGLAAGLVLRRLGWDVRIHERGAAPRTEGFALGLAPNAVNALRELGIMRSVDASRVSATGAEIRRPDGRVLRRFQSPIALPVVTVLRGDLHAELLQAVGTDTLVLESNATNLVVDGSRVTLKLRSGRAETADMLIGADGIDSVIRRRLHSSEPPPQASGYCAVRGLALDAGGLLGDLAGVVYLGDGVEAATLRVGREKVYWYFSLLAADIPDGAVDSMTAIRSQLARFDRTMHDIVAATVPEQMRFDRLLRRDPLGAWGTGPVTLLGDAAHPVMPHTAQGAAQALEDAVALGLALTRTGDVAKALRTYETVRLARTRTFIRLGPRIARVTTTRSRTVAAIRTAALKWTPEAVLTRAAGRAASDPHRALRESSRAWS